MDIKYESRYTKILEAHLRKHEIPWNKVNATQFEYHGKPFSVKPHRFGLCENNSENLKSTLDEMLEMYREPHAAIFLHRFYFEVDFTDRNTEYGQFVVDHLILEVGELPTRPKTREPEFEEDVPRDMHTAIGALPSQEKAAPVPIEKPKPVAKPEPATKPQPEKPAVSAKIAGLDYKLPEVELPIEPELKFTPEPAPTIDLTVELQEPDFPENPHPSSVIDTAKPAFSRPVVPTERKPVIVQTPRPVPTPKMTAQAAAPLSQETKPFPKAPPTMPGRSLPESIIRQMPKPIVKPIIDQNTASTKPVSQPPAHPEPIPEIVAKGMQPPVTRPVVTDSGPLPEVVAHELHQSAVKQTTVDTARPVAVSTPPESREPKPEPKVEKPASVPQSQPPEPVIPKTMPAPVPEPAVTKPVSERPFSTPEHKHAEPVKNDHPPVISEPLKPIEKKEESMESLKSAENLDYDRLQKDIIYLVQLLGRNLGIEVADIMAKAIVIIVRDNLSAGLDADRLHSDMVALIQLLGRGLNPDVADTMAKSIVIVAKDHIKN